MGITSKRLHYNNLFVSHTVMLQTQSFISINQLVYRLVLISSHRHSAVEQDLGICVDVQRESQFLYQTCYFTTINSFDFLESGSKAQQYLASKTCNYTGNSEDRVHWVIPIVLNSKCRSLYRDRELENITSKSHSNCDDDWRHPSRLSKAGFT